MSRFSDVNEIVKSESEEWLAYLHGQQLENLAHLKNSKSKVSSVFLRSLVFFYQLLRLWMRSLLVAKKNNVKADFYIYAGTANQAYSLVSTARLLAEKNKSIVAESGNNKLLSGANDTFEFDQLKVTVSDLLLAVLLFLYNAPRLYLNLKNKNSLLISQYFNLFCHVYIYLPVFYRLLTKYQPDYVVVSNDHNVDCRSLLAIAHFFNIKTVYMQHASVSELFPALTVDYAFLDGESALDTYLKCEVNLPNSYKNRELPKIFLSGQKKILSFNSENGKNIGLAINVLDDFLSVEELVNKLTLDCFVVNLRWHPGQAENDIIRIKEIFANNDMVILSDPRKQSVDRFLSNIAYMISGNSSIHLEAAVTGVIPIYYELQSPSIEDYYGYVKNGIAFKAESYECLINLLRKKEVPELNAAAIQYYSATYNTEWYGKEGELVVTTLLQLQAGKPWEELFGYKKYLNVNDEIIV